MVGEEGESGVVEGAGHVFEEGVDDYEGYVAGERRGRVSFGLVFFWFMECSSVECGGIDDERWNG